MDDAKTVTVDLPHDRAVARVEEAFRTQGFGTLTEIDVQATLEDNCIRSRRESHLRR